jgi:hypothetical protein
VEVLQEQRHPNVVLFMGVCVRPPAVITEFCESGSLNKLLEQVRPAAAAAAAAAAVYCWIQFTVTLWRLLQQDLLHTASPWAGVTSNALVGCFVCHPPRLVHALD